MRVGKKERQNPKRGETKGRDRETERERERQRERETERDRQIIGIPSFSLSLPHAQML